jgi:hypothetical protein
MDSCAKGVLLFVDLHEDYLLLDWSQPAELFFLGHPVIPVYRSNALQFGSGGNHVLKLAK